MLTTFDLLTAHPFLAGVQPRFVERLAGFAQRATFHAGEHVIREGARADTCYLLRDGYVDLTAGIAGRGDAVVDTIGPGRVLGWSWLFPPYRWQFSAVAVEPVLAIELDGPGVRGLCDTEVAFGYDLMNRFMAVMLQRMQATRARSHWAGGMSTAASMPSSSWARTARQSWQGEDAVTFRTPY